MKTSEFAKTYLGRRVRVFDEYVSAMPSKAIKEGHIIGYEKTIDDDGRIMIQWDPYPGVSRGWELSNASTNIILLDRTAEYAWLINKEYIEIIKDIKPSIAYPNTCSICKHPSRTYKKLVLCSNDRCKTKRGIKTFVSAFPKPPKSMRTDKEGYILCPVCQKRAIKIKVALSSPHLKHARMCVCSCGNEWLCEFLEGDRVIHLGINYSFNYQDLFMPITEV